MITLNRRSLDRLKGVHPDLVRVVKRAAAISTLDFMVTEGLRTPQRQAELVKAGASKTLNSRHLTGHAVDLAAIVDKRVRWDWPLYITLANVMREGAELERVPVIWGGHWALLNGGGLVTMKHLSRTFPDGPHFELPRKTYP